MNTTTENRAFTPSRCRRKALALGIAMVLAAPGWADEQGAADEMGPPEAEVAAPAPAGIANSWADSVQVSGVVEVEAGAWDGDHESGSDLSLATVELGVDAKVNAYTEAHLLLLYEEGENDDEIALDEGIITIAHPAMGPAYLSAGRMYVPFGSFATQMVSDPLTLEIGETGETAVLFGYEGDQGLYGSLYLFNGDTRDGGDDTIEHWGGNIGYTWGDDLRGLEMGASYISSIGDSDGLDLREVADYEGGLGVHATAHAGRFTVVAEYVAAMGDLAGPGTEVAAWNLEAGYHFDIAERPSTVALGYQQTEDGEAFGLPETRVLAALSVDVLDNTAIGLEWARDEFYDDTENDTTTVQLAAEF